MYPSHKPLDTIGHIQRLRPKLKPIYLCHKVSSQWHCSLVKFFSIKSHFSSTMWKHFTLILLIIFHLCDQQMIYLYLHNAKTISSIWMELFVVHADNHRNLHSIWMQYVLVIGTSIRYKRASSSYLPALSISKKELIEDLSEDISYQS